jgi:hypothetical protein
VVNQSHPAACRACSWVRPLTVLANDGKSQALWPADRCGSRDSRELRHSRRPATSKAGTSGWSALLQRMAALRCVAPHSCPGPDSLKMNNRWLARRSGALDLGLFPGAAARCRRFQEGLNNTSLTVGIVNSYRRVRLAFRIQVVMSKVPHFDGANCRKSLRFSFN